MQEYIELTVNEVIGGSTICFLVGMLFGALASFVGVYKMFREK